MFGSAGAKNYSLQRTDHPRHHSGGESVNRQGVIPVNCYIHIDREPVGTCTSCGRPICYECAVDVRGKLVCRRCLGTGRAISPSTLPRPPKDRGTALILEILPGLFGFLGFGWIYSGNTSAGIMWLVGYLIWSYTIVIPTGVLTYGLCLFCTAPISITLLVISVYSLNEYIRQHPELFGGI